MSEGRDRREAFKLTARELELAILFAHGMGIRAIGSCVGLRPPYIEVALMNANRKMSTAPNAHVASPDRRYMHDWLSNRGLLPDRRDSEAALARAISAQRESEAVLDGALSAIENAPSPWPRWVRGLMWALSRRPTDRDRLSKRSVEAMAVLEEAQRAIREPFP
jgi:DNA-binding CsgD family transcriptional regulator